MSLDRQARRYQYGAFLLAALVTLGWMTGIGFGIAVAASDDVEFVRDTPLILMPSLMGAAMVAISAVILTLLAIIRRIRLRAHAMEEALPALIGRESDGRTR